MTTRRNYEKTVKAAVAEAKSKFALAEALAEDIPPRQSGKTVGLERIEKYLGDAREAIIEAGGEPKAVSTLAEYRHTAIWVCGVNTTKSQYRWIKGVSYTAHAEARKAGMSYEDFAALPPENQKVREIRKENEVGSPDGPLAPRVARATVAEKQEIAKALAVDPEVRDEVSNAVREGEREALKTASDEVKVATAARALKDAEDAASTIKDTGASRTVKKAMEQTRENIDRKHHERVTEELEKRRGEPDPALAELAGFMDALKRAGDRDFTSVIPELGNKLRQKLREVPEWLIKYGHVPLPELEPYDPAIQTWGDLLRLIVREERAKTDAEYALALGESLSDEVAAFLAIQEGGDR